MEYYVMSMSNGEVRRFNIFNSVPFLRNCFAVLRGKYTKRNGKYKVTISNEELLPLIEDALRWQFWSRFQYEMLVKELTEKDTKINKIDVWYQLEKNVPVIVNIIRDNEQEFLELVNKEGKPAPMV